MQQSIVIGFSTLEVENFTLCILYLPIFRLAKNFKVCGRCHTSLCSRSLKLAYIAPLEKFLFFFSFSSEYQNSIYVGKIF